MSTAVIDEIISHAKTIRSGEHDTIKPGQPFTIPESWVAGDAVAQGDLIITVIDAVPKGYAPVKMTPKDVQLVPGVTEGAKHCLDGTQDVELFRLKDWEKQAEETFAGPVIKAGRDTTVLHPVHGPVTIPKGFTVRCDYQREYDLILKQERRNAD